MKKFKIFLKTSFILFLLPIWINNANENQFSKSNNQNLIQKTCSASLNQNIKPKTPLLVFNTFQNKHHDDKRFLTDEFYCTKNKQILADQTTVEPSKNIKNLLSDHQKHINTHLYSRPCLATPICIEETDSIKLDNFSGRPNFKLN